MDAETAQGHPCTPVACPYLKEPRLRACEHSTTVFWRHMFVRCHDVPIERLHEPLRPSTKTAPEDTGNSPLKAAYADPALLLSLLSLFMRQPPTQRCAPSCVTLQNARRHRTTTPPLTTIVLRILYCLRGQCGSRLKCTETCHKLLTRTNTKHANKAPMVAGSQHLWLLLRKVALR